MPYHRHSRRKKNRKSHRLLLLGSALIVAAAICAMMPSTRDRFAAKHEVIPTVHHESEWKRWNSSIPARASESEASRSHAKRTVYPYSIVPGGVLDAGGLREAVSRDAVVAAHYSGFKLADAHVVRLRAAKFAHVSYRLGNKIYWTRKTVRLAPGEAVITDGEHFARTRCGNRFAESPAGEISPEEPIAEVLDQPVESLDALPEPGPRSIESESDPLPAPAQGIPDFSIPGDLPVGISGRFLPPTSGPSVIPSGPPPASPLTLFPPGSLIPPSEPPFDQPAPVPEPGTLLLLSSGLSAIIARRRKFQK